MPGERIFRKFPNKFKSMCVSYSQENIDLNETSMLQKLKLRLKRVVENAADQMSKQLENSVSTHIF